MKLRDAMENVVSVITEPKFRVEHRREIIRIGGAKYEPWYGRGFIRQHYTTGLFGNRGYCGAVIIGVSSGELRTFWPFHCGACQRVNRKALKTREATPNTR